MVQVTRLTRAPPRTHSPAVSRSLPGPRMRPVVQTMLTGRRAQAAFRSGSRTMAICVDEARGAGAEDHYFSTILVARGYWRIRNARGPAAGRQRVNSTWGGSRRSDAERRIRPPDCRAPPAFPPGSRAMARCRGVPRPKTMVRTHNGCADKQLSELFYTTFVLAMLENTNNWRRWRPPAGLNPSVCHASWADQCSGNRP